MQEPSPVTPLQEHTRRQATQPVFARFRDRLREAGEDLRAAESRAQAGGDTPSGALATSIAAVHLQVTDLIEYVDLLEWASAVCAVTDDLAAAIEMLGSSGGAAGVATFEAGSARLAASSRHSKRGHYTRPARARSPTQPQS